MSLIKPFAGLRPAPGRAAEVAAPPYDVMSTAEARTMVADRPWSFLHISRPEVDLPEGVDPYGAAVYERARANLATMIDEGILVRDPQPRYYVYRLTMGAHRQTGLAVTASVAAYENDRIRRHELTRPVKEDDRVRQIEALGAQTGPVFLVHPSTPAIDDRLEAVTRRDAPEVDITRADGVRHELWSIAEPEPIAELTAAFEALPALYVADGHHRCAAAARVAARRRDAMPNQDGDTPADHFLAVTFPHTQMQVLDYNRVVRDLNGLDAETFLRRVGEVFEVTPSGAPVKPVRPGQFGLYLDGAWYLLAIGVERIPQDDPVARLDVSLLQEHLIGPILGIADPRRDERIDFVGGIRGLGGLTARVDSGEMCLAFTLFATRIEDLMAVADAGAVMPPKSTWFEPKLADGLVSHLLD
ncbi:hypothetical protein Thimo_1562 [Thioflavicoccus mobilis 8321]|uniref:DUF1015 domain-containing protein n=1 Tax=Thioflavicoccus mobilis 8321 TaxID=765912 RepID=L0GU92_9GAMM|nr:DUF1015 family protein [Thioflavicoccus mobilis]AGA90343.1 hypothetical protein Thimo_1562 [Thioflavicoccus mobilis 8321]